MAKRYTIRRIKKNKVYTVAELAEETGVTEQTVRRWLKAGMVAIDTQRPTYILGEAATDFLKAQQAKAKRPMKLYQLLCLSCKKPCTPLGMLADYTPQSPVGGRLSALCSECEQECFRNVRASQLPELRQHLDIVDRGSE